MTYYFFQLICNTFDQDLHVLSSVSSLYWEFDRSIKHSWKQMNKSRGKVRKLCSFRPRPPSEISEFLKILSYAKTFGVCPNILEFLAIIMC